MKHIFLSLPVVAGLLACISLDAQTSYYKNVFGDYGQAPAHNTPEMVEMHKQSDGGYILIGGPNGTVYTACYRKVDSLFNPVWTTNVPGANNAYFQEADELPDGGTIGVYASNNAFLLVKTDANGTIQFSNQISSPNAANFASYSVCPSVEQDTGFLAMYVACALDYGLARFDKNGVPLWCYEYGGNGLRGSVYNLLQAHDYGYLTVGAYRDPNTLFITGVMAQMDNQGQVVRSKQYNILPTEYTGLYLLHKGDNGTYFVTAKTYNGSPYVFDPRIYLLQLDSTLNVMNTWRFDAPNASDDFYMTNIESASDGSLIINGSTIDSGSAYQRLYVMKFNPLGGGSIVWSKRWQPTLPSFYPINYPRPGLFVKPSQQDEITMALHGGNDGSCVAVMDSSGNGLCGLVPVQFTLTHITGSTAAPITLTPQLIQLNRTNVPLPTSNITYGDTLLCGSLPNGISEPPATTENNLVNVSAQNRQCVIENKTNTRVSIRVFSSTGQLIAQKELAPYASENVALPARGMYLVSAATNAVREVKKVVAE